MSFEIPAGVVAVIGPILATEEPFQGEIFQVRIVTTPRGRFVLKTGDTPTKVAELTDEAQVLAALGAYAPLVAQPIGRVGDIFIFTYLAGENLVLALPKVDEAERHRLVGAFGRALRLLHGWSPTLPRPADWIGATLAHIETIVAARPPGAEVGRTNTRFDHAIARDLLAEVRAQVPAMQGPLVFGHGDYCLPNVLAHAGQLSGIIDWSRGGYADPRFDLATGLFTLRYNHGGAPTYLATFLRAYGYADSLESLAPFEALHALTSMSEQ